MTEYNGIIKNIVRTQGAFREKEILKNGFTVEKTETWNKSHKVLNVLSNVTESDGYNNGFQVDIATFSICG